MNYTKGIFISVIGYIASISMLVILSPSFAELLDNTPYAQHWNNTLKHQIEFIAVIFGIACTLCLYGFIRKNIFRTNKNR